MMTVVLVTGRLVLRRFVAADLGDLAALDADPEVMHFITGGHPTPRREIEDDVLPVFIGAHATSSALGYWAVEERSTGQFLGWFHLRPGEGHGDDEPELGYRLRRSAWGRGFATEGSRALLDAAFAEPDVQRVLAQTMSVHTASRRVMEKSGLRLVRSFTADWPFPIPGDEHGDVEYAITRVEWEQRAPDRPGARPPGS